MACCSWSVSRKKKMLKNRNTSWTYYALSSLFLSSLVLRAVMCRSSSAGLNSSPSCFASAWFIIFSYDSVCGLKNRSRTFKVVSFYIHESNLSCTTLRDAIFLEAQETGDTISLLSESRAWFYLYIRSHCGFHHAAWQIESWSLAPQEFQTSSMVNSNK